MSSVMVAWFAITTSSATATAATTQWPGGNWQPDPAAYGMTVVQNIPIKMNDGVTLIANVGYPSDLSTGQRASGTFPVLLTQDPYTAQEQPNAYYVIRGYINAVVEVRGTGTTHGPDGKEIAGDFFGPRSTKDGVALVHWAAHELSGSNGIIGLDGCSYLGIDQIFTAAAVGTHSPIKEILPACASNDYNNYFAGGIPSQVAGLFNSPLAASLDPDTTNAAASTAENDALEHQFVTGGPGAYNNSYWQQRTTFNVIPKIVKNKIPALLWSGWYPTDGPGSLLEYAIFQNAYDHRSPRSSMTPGQKTTGRYQIVVGPWMHGQGLDETIQLEWYDTWLKGEHTGMTATKTPMHLYVLQSKKWINSKTYPMTNDYTALHLGSAGKLSSSTTAGSATLKWAQPTVSDATLTFNSQPFTSAKVIGGPVAATVYARSNNRNLELNGTLYDVAPSGQRTEIDTGTVLGSLRKLETSRSWYDEHGLMILPYHPYSANQYAPATSLQRYDISLPPTLYEIAPRHHLQFILTTQTLKSDCASLLSALTTPLPCILSTPQNETLPGGVYQVVWGTSHPSSLNVPLLSPGSLSVTTSGVTETSNNLTEPLDWGTS